MTTFEKKVEDYWKETQKVYNKFTDAGGIAENSDYYVFQTTVKENPNLMIIGINPGGNGKNGKNVLSNGSNLYLDPSIEWFKTVQSIFGYPNNSALSMELENCVGTNRIFINTGSADQLHKEITNDKECGDLVKGWVYKIINPKYILAFGRDTFNFLAATKSKQKSKQFGDIKLEYATTRIGDKEVCYIPNPSKLNHTKGYFSEKNLKSWQEALKWFLLER